MYMETLQDSIKSLACNGAHRNRLLFLLFSVLLGRDAVSGLCIGSHQPPTL